jgi:starch synthase (maltosyl-transferring)
MNGQQRIIIEHVTPQVDNGEYPVKRVVGDRVRVEADIFCDGHDSLSAEVLYKFSTGKNWQRIPMHPGINDRWEGSFRVTRIGIYFFRIHGWVDHFKSWHQLVLKKIETGTDYALELMTGAELIKECLKNQEVTEKDQKKLNEVLKQFTSTTGNEEEKIASIIDNALYDVMASYPQRTHVSGYERQCSIEVDREKANFSTWYEVFPRSLGKDQNLHGTFRDCIDFLPYVAETGFDVLYLPPVHPIGTTNRKGKNNSTASEPGDPGSPWAIGNKEGGHKSIHPELGTLHEFEKLVEKASEYGIEIALDIAFQCSPDHPYIREHPEWFRYRPDGSMQYAENPPKKYEDIYPINFETDDWQSLWNELKSVFLYWIGKNVRIFRVDNPHTKSIRFWGWVIREIKKQHPDVLFLAEAFTRPKVMYQLAKQGFTQSYTYFTWRNTKQELTSYCEELVNTEVREFFRPNFWPNTPDILSEFLQHTNRAGFIQRIVLAATLGSNYGIYGPVYELMENAPLEPGKEEYLNSEKYEIRQWDMDAQQNLRKVIRRINQIRRENKALQNTHSLKFHHVDNEALICYSKTSEDLDNIILVVVNLDANYTQSGWISFPVQEFGMDDREPYQVHELMGGAFHLWNGGSNYVEINPGIMPFHIFKVRRKIRSERDFDYFM